jgi:hypothetical protein
VSSPLIGFVRGLPQKLENGLDQIPGMNRAMEFARSIGLPLGQPAQSNWVPPQDGMAGATTIAPVPKRRMPEKKDDTSKGQ